jgi:hypothetical protein
MTRWIVLVAALLAAPGVKALECPAMQGIPPELSQIDAQKRLDFIRSRLDRSAYNLGIWKWTWTGVFAGITIGQGIATKTDSELSQVKWAVGTAVSGIGLIGTLIGKHRALNDAPVLDATPDGATPAATCYALAKAEEFLIRDAEDDHHAKWGPLNHLLNGGLNLVAGLVLGIFFHQWGNGLTQFVAGTAVGELQIFVQPMTTVDALEDYRAGRLDLAPPGYPVPHVSNPTLQGYQLALAF